MTLIICTGLLLLVLASELGLAFVRFGARRQKATNFRYAVGAQSPRSTIVLDDTLIAFNDSGGTGPPIICLPAIGHGARDFEELSTDLGREFRVIAIDFPGQGNSGPDRYPASASRYANLLTLFIDRIQLHQVILIGNSIGGATAVRYTHAHPRRVKALILCDSGGLDRPGPVARLFISGFVQFFAAGRRGAVWFPWAFSHYYQHVLISESAREERIRIIQSSYEIAPILEQAWKSFSQPEENLWPILPEIHRPVLLAWARNDIVIPLNQNKAAFDRFPNHELAIFRGGHAAFLEDPANFEKVLRTFLGGLKEVQVVDRSGIAGPGI